MEKLHDVYVVTRKVYNRNCQTGNLNIWETGISGVFADAESARNFTEQVINGIGHMDSRRSFRLSTDNIKSLPNFEFAYKQCENITPIFIFECTRETILPQVE